MSAWGDVPTWVGSVLTGSSLLIASGSYRQSVSDRRSGQASLVSAWLAEKGEPLGPGGARLEEDTVFVRNSSTAAVSLVVLHHDDPTSPGGPKGVSAWRSVGPGLTVSSPSLVSDRQLLPSVLMFVDSSGRPWRRLRSGVLEGARSRNRDQLRSSLENYF